MRHVVFSKHREDKRTLAIAAAPPPDTSCRAKVCGSAAILLITPAPCSSLARSKCASLLAHAPQIARFLSAVRKDIGTSLTLLQSVSTAFAPAAISDRKLVADYICNVFTNASLYVPHHPRGFVDTIVYMMLGVAVHRGQLTCPRPVRSSTLAASD